MLQPFTWDYYDACLAAAIASTYRFIGFAGLADGRFPDEPFILLRHDVDYDPEHAERLAAREARHGVQATYFFQTDSRFYDLSSPRVETAVRLQATLRDLRTGATLWSQSGLVFREQYDVPETEAAFFDQETLALDEIARGASGALVSSIFEGF